MQHQMKAFAHALFTLNAIAPHIPGFSEAYLSIGEESWGGSRSSGAASSTTRVVTGTRRRRRRMTTKTSTGAIIHKLTPRQRATAGDAPRKPARPRMQIG